MDKTLVAIFNLSDGRDKLLKVAQYSIKIIIWGLSFKKIPENLDTAFNSLQKVLSDSRRVFRIGNWITAWNDVYRGISYEKHLFLEITSFLSMIGVLITSCCDDVSWFLKSVGSTSSHREKVSQVGDIAWTFSLVLDLIPQTKDLFESYLKEKQLKMVRHQNGEVYFAQSSVNKNQLHAIYKERWMLYLNEIKSLADLPIAVTYGFNLKTNPGIIAISGFISALLGLYKIWFKLHK